MEFEFNNQLLPQNVISIEKVGEFALEASSETGLYYYYLVKTVLGQCVAASCGPIIPYQQSIPPGFSINIYKMPYNETKLIKLINGFLNDKNKMIVEAKEIDIDDAIDQFREVKEYLRDLKAETF